jgi:hypothetical protein
MSQAGIGAMLHYLGGGSEHNAAEYYGRAIKSVTLNNEAHPNRLEIAFEDGTQISIRDDGQSCCESRYMTTDDDPCTLVGKRLTKVEPKEHKEKNGDYDAHEMVFVEVAAEGEHITIVNHNEHNGYYGGFGLTITEDRTAAE